MEEDAGETKEAAPTPAPAPAAPAKPVETAAAPVGGEFSYAQLKGNPCEVQSSIDAKSKEQYLSDSEFLEIFKMDKAAFAGLAGWKKTKAKKSAGLF